MSDIGKPERATQDRVIALFRDELDEQIEGVFTEAGEVINRTSSGRELMCQLGQATPRLLCSLVHKFGRKDVDNFEQFIKELQAQASRTVGEIFVFVDECHRTQSGKLHRVMKAMMPNAVFTRWCTCWSPLTTIVSLLSWISSCRSGSFTGMS